MSKRSIYEQKEYKHELYSSSMDHAVHHNQPSMFLFIPRVSFTKALEQLEKKKLYNLIQIDSSSVGFSNSSRLFLSKESMLC